MHLNYDCIRDVLLNLEELLQIKYDNGSFSFSIVNIEHLYESMPQGYSIEDTLYSVLNLNEAGYINASLDYNDGKLTDCLITGITYDGNEFLNKIRPEKVWTKIKKTVNSVGSVTLPVISEIATSVLTSFFKAKLGLSE